MNDLVTPFLITFLAEQFAAAAAAAAPPPPFGSGAPSSSSEQSLTPPEEWGDGLLDALPEPALLDAEADAYWCLCRLLEAIQDHYTYAQPGIQRAVFRLKDLMRCVCA